MDMNHIGWSFFQIDDVLVTRDDDGSPRVDIILKDTSTGEYLLQRVNGKADKAGNQQTVERAADTEVDTDYYRDFRKHEEEEL